LQLVISSASLESSRARAAAAIGEENHFV